MNDIFLVGPSYCGKSAFSEILQKTFNYEVVHVGELVRKICSEKGTETPVLLDSESLCGVIAGQLRPLQYYIIDNAFKTVSQMEACLKQWENLNRDWRIIWIVDKRTNVDFTARGRADDSQIQSKRELWKQNEAQMLTELKEKYPGSFTIVENTDFGFYFKKE